MISFPISSFCNVVCCNSFTFIGRVNILFAYWSILPASNKQHQDVVIYASVISSLFFQLKQYSPGSHLICIRPYYFPCDEQPLIVFPNPVREDLCLERHTEQTPTLLELLIDLLMPGLLWFLSVEVALRTEQTALPWARQLGFHLVLGVKTIKAEVYPRCVYFKWRENWSSWITWMCWVNSLLLYEGWLNKCLRFYLLIIFVCKRYLLLIMRMWGLSRTLPCPSVLSTPHSSLHPPGEPHSSKQGRQSLSGAVVSSKVALDHNTRAVSQWG